MKLTLYSFRRCPYAIRARLILTLIEEPFSIIEVSLKNKPKEMLALSPKGTVPVLVCEGSPQKVIDESLDILHWALEKRYPKNWRQPNATQEKKAQVWQDLLTKNFIPGLNQFKYALSHEPEKKERGRKVVLDFLEKLDREISGAGSILAGPSWIDISMFPFIRQLRGADQSWFDQLKFPKIHRWLHSWLDSEEFIHIMKKETCENQPDL